MFKYRSDNPSTIDFDYDAYVAVNPSTGEHTGISVEPIMDNIDVLSMEEAEQIAKEYIVSNYDQELEDITTTFNQIFTCRNKLFYSFCFDYGEGDGCSITISAETGAIDGIGF